LSGSHKKAPKAEKLIIYFSALDAFANFKKNLNTFYFKTPATVF